MTFGRVRSRAFALTVVAGVATVCAAVPVLVRCTAPAPTRSDVPAATNTVDAPLDRLPRF